MRGVSILLTVLVVGGMSKFAWAQTEGECMKKFEVDSTKNVVYIAFDASKKYQVGIQSASCINAERFRQQLYVSMDKSLYDSEQALKNRLETAQMVLAKLESDLQKLNDEKSVKGAIKGATAVIATVGATATTAACASAVVNGVGLAACGPAAVAQVAMVAAWDDLIEFTGELAKLKSAAIGEIKKQRSTVNAVLAQLSAASAKSMKNNHSQLFLAICRAVKEQCR